MKKMIKMNWATIQEFVSQWFKVDRWFYLGFSGASVSGFGSWFLEHGGKMITIIGGAVMLGVSVWQKLRANQREQIAFEKEEERKNLKFKQELKQDQELHEKNLLEK